MFVEIKHVFCATLAACYSNVGLPAFDAPPILLQELVIAKNGKEADVAEPLRIGVIGAGGWARQSHLPSFQKMAGAEVVVVCNRTEASAQRVAEEFGVPRAVTDWRDVVAMPDVDAVVVATWPYMHGPAAIAALEAGKHVMCLGRMAMDLAEARNMAEVAERAKEKGVRSVLVPPGFALAGDAYMRNLLRDGYVGKVHHVLAVFLSPSQIDPVVPANWRQDRDLSGVNILLLGAHYEVTRRWVGDATGVFAREQTFTRERPATDGSGRMVPVTVPDATTVIAELAQGGTITYLESSVARFGGPPRFEIYGSEGTLVYRTQGDQIFGARGADKELQPLPIPDDQRKSWTLEQDFVRMIRENGPDIEPTFADGVAYMTFTQAARLSATLGTWVPIPLMGDGELPARGQHWAELWRTPAS